MADNEKSYFEFIDIPDGNGGTERMYAKDAEAQAAIQKIEQEIEELDPASVEGKANKVTSATAGNLAGLDSNGDLTDSGSKPSDFATSSHTHGNIQNSGALQTSDVSIANGDKIVITDASDSNKIARTSVAFDGSDTTKALTPKGTFESFSKFSGSYTDLSDKPTIPAAANNGTFSVKTKVGDAFAVTVADFTANQSGNDDVTLVQGNNVTLTTNTTNRTVTIAATDTTYSEATTSAAGLMSSSDKTKLNGIESGAEVNVNADWNATSGDAKILNKPTLGSAAAKDVPLTGNATSSQVVMGNDSRLSDSRPASDVSSWAKASTKPSYTSSEVGLGNVTNDAQVKRTEMGANNGVATLDSTGKVPSSQLPSYVDDVIEGYYYNSKFYKESAHTTEITPESGKIYVDLATDKTYRWSGSAYVVISETLALGETSSTAYRGDRGKTAYDHSQSTHARTDATNVAASSTNGNIKINGTETTVYTHPGSGTNPHGTTKSDVGLGNVGNFKAVSTVASQGLSSTEQSNARANIGAGTSSFSGSYNDLSNKPTIPTVNDAKFSIKGAGVEVASTTSNASSASSVDIVAGSNVTITPDATNKKITIAATDTTYTSKSESSGGTDVSLVTTGEKYTWNHKGTYSKPSGGIPKTDLADAVQTSIGKADSAIQTITAAAGANIGSVGTPSVTASTSGTSTTLTFNYLKGDKGDKGTTPTIAAAAGSNIGTVGTPSVTASTSGTTTTFTFNYLKGAKGDPGQNATTTSVFTSSANGLAPASSSTNKTTAETSQSKYYLCEDAKYRQLPANAFNDTKNTAGGDNTTSKIFLVGMTSQTSSSGNAQTYTNVNCYASGGYLYSGGEKVITGSVASTATCESIIDELI